MFCPLASFCDKDEEIKFRGIEVIFLRTKTDAKISVFWDITPNALLKIVLCFGGTCRLNLQAEN
jgi:hypothetical protein